MPAKPPERRTATRDGVVLVLPALVLPAAGVTPTVVHACWTIAACAPAAATVAAAKPAKSVFGPTFLPVSAAYQILPAPSAELPPIPVAASWNARLGMPLLMWTPPLSLLVWT